MPRKNFVSYTRAKAVAKEHGITHREAWRLLARESKAARHALNIPVNPEVFYASEFEGWEVFLDCKYRLTITSASARRDFTEVRADIQARSFKSRRDFSAWANSPDCPTDIPRDPARAYAKEGWSGFPDFLGANPLSGSEKQFDTFSQARAWAREKLVANSNHWRELAESGKLPEGLPVHPDLTYASQWPGWERFLGQAYRIRDEHPFAPFEEAAAWAKTSGIRNSVQWREKAHRLPTGIPTHPEVYYSDDWRSWASFLGAPAYHSRIRASIVKLEVAQDWAQKNCVQSAADWRQQYKVGLLPSGFPSDPSRAYGRSWKDWYIFLGKDYPEQRNH